MRTTLLINLIVAVTTYSVCLLAPWFMEHAALSRQDALRSKGPSSLPTDLRLVGSAVEVPAVFVPSATERLEAAHRARVWMQRLDVCKSSAGPAGPPRWCGGEERKRGVLNAAAVVRRLALYAVPSSGSARVLIQATAWMGSAAIELLLLNSAQADGHVVVLGSTASCRSMLEQYTHHVSTMHCLDVQSHRSPPVGVWLGLRDTVVFENCSVRTSCTATTSRSTNPESTGSMAHVQDVAPHVLVLDVDVELSSLALSSMFDSMRWLARAGKHSSVVVHWHCPGSRRDKLALQGAFQVLQPDVEGLRAAFIVHTLHGACVAPHAESFAEFSTRYLESSWHASRDSTAEAYRSSCVFILRHTSAEQLFSLESLFHNDDMQPVVGGGGHQTLGGRASRRLTQPGVESGVVDVLLISTAVLVGGALCYGISKNWIGKKKRRTLASAVSSSAGAVV